MMKYKRGCVFDVALALKSKFIFLVVVTVVVPALLGAWFSLQANYTGMSMAQEVYVVGDEPYVLLLNFTMVNSGRVGGEIRSYGGEVTYMLFESGLKGACPTKVKSTPLLRSSPRLKRDGLTVGLMETNASSSYLHLYILNNSSQPTGSE